MPYKTINDLPDSVQDVLPKHAQDIYKEAFNSSYQQYQDSQDRRGDETQETVAHKVAWSAVKKAGYSKGDDYKWHKD